MTRNIIQILKKTQPTKNQAIDQDDSIFKKAKDDLIETVELNQEFSAKIGSKFSPSFLREE